MYLSNNARIRIAYTLPLLFAGVAACSATNMSSGNGVLGDAAGSGAFGVAGSAGAPILGAAGSSSAAGNGASVGAAGSLGGASGTGETRQGPSMAGTTGSEFGGAGGAAGSAAPVAGHGGAGDSSGVGGAAGAAGSSSSNGGSGSLPGVCAGGKVGKDSSSLNAGTEYGAVKYQSALTNDIVDLKTTMIVPKEPTASGTLFIWPGLQSRGGKDPAGNGNGILQPVLTWGRSCAPGMPMDFSSWWISAMYVNVSSAAAGPTGCAGGNAMNVAVGDALVMDMSLSGTSWKQVVDDMQSAESVNFTIDLKGQTQNWATWAIELPVGGGNVKPSEGVVFTQNMLTFASPVTSCQPNQRGPNDTFTAPVLSTDGLHCCIDKIVLRAQGVPATM